MAKKIMFAAGGFILVLVLLGGGFLWGKSTILNSPVETVTETDNSEVILAVQRREEVVLLSTSTQGIYTTQNTAKLFKWGVPGSRKTNILQYKFTAKLGLDGREVKVEETSPGHFKLTIPPFKFIGFSDPEFKTVHQHGQVLSFATADIDTAEGINEVLNEGKRKEHIQLNHDLLKDQTKTFYEGIIRAIDTEAKVEFEFQTAAK